MILQISLQVNLQVSLHPFTQHGRLASLQVSLVASPLAFLRADLQASLQVNPHWYLLLLQHLHQQDPLVQCLRVVRRHSLVMNRLRSHQAYQQ